MFLRRLIRVSEVASGNWLCLYEDDSTSTAAAMVFTLARCALYLIYGLRPTDLAWWAIATRSPMKETLGEQDIGEIMRIRFDDPMEWYDDHYSGRENVLAEIIGLVIRRYTVDTASAMFDKVG
ncbi:Hypothetical protein D9617_8g051940 [Elsinoe fawcettii]|nr:Hypothetical protein D9617_8g051940 [Elsinoe fawcettii]